MTKCVPFEKYLTENRLDIILTRKWWVLLSCVKIFIEPMESFLESVQGKESMVEKQKFAWHIFLTIKSLALLWAVLTPVYR